MNKNVLTVLIVILTPIIVLGLVAVAGAEKFAEQKEALEAEHNNENATESATILVPMQTVKIVNAQSNNLLGAIDLRAVA
jgi:Flp pilus assembly protein CpaB